MGRRNHRLSLMGKGSKNVAARGNCLPLENSSDNVQSEAVYCMVLEVHSGGLVSFVLKMSNTQHVALALLGSAGKEVAYTAILLLNDDIQFKECVY